MKKAVLLMIIVFSIIRCGSVMDLLDPKVELTDPNKVATPVITPPNGSTFWGIKTVSITCSTVGAEIRYTTDGSNPTPTYGTYYTNPFTINATATIRAIAYKAGMTDSPVVTAVITITYQRFMVNGDGTITDSQTGLMWTQNGASPMPWSSANYECSNLTIGGYSGWRLPTKYELQFLINTGAQPYSNWLNSQGFINIQPADYWTSDPYGTSYYAVSLDTGYEKITSGSIPLNFLAVRNP